MQTPGHIGPCSGMYGNNVLFSSAVLHAVHTALRRSSVILSLRCHHSRQGSPLAAVPAVVETCISYITALATRYPCLHLVPHTFGAVKEFCDRKLPGS